MDSAEFILIVFSVIQNDAMVLFNFSEILNKIEGIVYFSKSIMKLYREKVNELQIIEKKQNHVLAAVNYGKYLEAIKNNENIMDDNDKM